MGLAMVGRRHCRPRWSVRAAVLIGALAWFAPGAHAVDAPAFGSNVPYPPLENFSCSTGLSSAVDVGTAVAKQCYERAFGAKPGDYGKLPEYLAFVPQALFAAFVPVTREWLAAEFASKLGKDAKVCILTGLAQGMGASAETQALVKASSEEFLALESQRKFVADAGKYKDLFKALRENGDKYVQNDPTLAKSLTDFQKFSFYVDKKLKSQASALEKPGGLVNALSAWINQAQLAQREAGRAQLDADNCEFDAAIAKLASAQVLATKRLTVLRTEISRAKKAIQCEEDLLAKNPQRGLQGDNQFAVNNIRRAQNDLRAYEDADRDMVTYMAELPRLAAKFSDEEGKLEELRERGQKELEQARAALAQCDLAGAERFVSAHERTFREDRCNDLARSQGMANQALPSPGVFLLSQQIRAKREQTAREKQEAETEYNSIMALNPTTAEECTRMELVAGFLERWSTEDACRDRLDAGAKAAGLRNKAATCRQAVQNFAISVTTATYGLNCADYQTSAGHANTVGRGKETGAVAVACDGKPACTFIVDYMKLGDPAYGCQKDFQVEYSCGGGAKTASASPEAGYGSPVSLSCP